MKNLNNKISGRFNKKADAVVGYSLARWTNDLKANAGG